MSLTWLLLNQRLYFLYFLRRLNSSSLKMFYSSIIESIICFGISCWVGSITLEDNNRINRIIRKASKMIKCDLPLFNCLWKNACHEKFSIIPNNPSHPLKNKSSSSGYFLQPSALTEQYKNSFVPSSDSIHRECVVRR